MAQTKSILNDMVSHVIKAPSKVKRNKKEFTHKSDLTMESYMKEVNPYGNPIKIYKPVIDILIHSRPTTRVVMGFLFENIKQDTHLVEMEWQKFVKKGYGSRDTFYRGIVDLKEKNLIRKKSGQIYEINPDFVFKGNKAKFIMKVQSGMV